MSEQKSYPRPRQVTVAAFTGIAGGVLLVLSLFDAVGRLRTVEMRDAVEEFLAEPPGDGLGVSVAWVLDALHVVMLVNGALAAVATVLAVYLLWGHRGARIGFTVAAGILLITAPFSGGFLAVLLAFAATMLWSRPAREWFAGRDPEQVPAEAFARPRQREQPDPSWPPPAQRTDRPSGSPESGDRPPPASHPFGQRTEKAWAPPTGQPSATDPPPSGEGRPVSVVVATLITWLFSGLALCVFAFMVVLLMVGQDTLLAAAEENPRLADFAPRDLLAALWVISALGIVWCVSALVIAVLAFRRVDAARIALTLSCVMTILGSLLLLPFGAVLMAAAGATVGLLFSRSSSRWFARRPVVPHDGPPGQPSQHPQQQPPSRPSGKPPVW